MSSFALRRYGTAWLARLAVAWFVLSIGAMSWAPAFQASEPTSDGICPMLSMSEAGHEAAAAHAPSSQHAGGDPHCPLCMAAAAPPPVLQVAVAPRVFAGTALQRWNRASRVVATPAAPIPARGPPVVG